jgi:hypothetical protein
MWFAALGNARANPWIVGLMLRLLQGSPPVLGLFGSNPFPQHPPRYVRAMLYDYRFTDRSAHDATGQWWARASAGMYFPPVSLDDFHEEDSDPVGPDASGR